MSDDEDPYQYWRDVLAGKHREFYDADPRAGFYRWPHKAAYQARKTYKPVAYWLGDDGTILCAVDNEMVSPRYGSDLWTRVGTHPVTEEAYREVANGGRWPDEHELVPMDRGSNQAPDDNSYEGLKEAIEDLAREAEQLVVARVLPANQAEADRLSNLADRLTELSQRADDARAAEKKPHDEAAKEVQGKWKPVVTRAQEGYRGIKTWLLTPYLAQRQREAREAAERAVAQGIPQPEVERARAGTRGRAMSIREHKTAKIVDRDKVLAFFRDNEMVTTTLELLANKAVKLGVDVPGIEIIVEERAV